MLLLTIQLALLAVALAGTWEVAKRRGDAEGAVRAMFAVKQVGDARYIAGWSKGWDKGYDSGKVHGLSDGYKRGHRAGYEDGFRAALDSDIDAAKARRNCAALLIADALDGLA